MRKAKFKTVRCILRRDDRFLLVVHSNAMRVNRGRWGLPGGRIERGEDFEQTARREIREELGLVLGALHEVGDYRYKGSLHKVFGTDSSDPIVRFSRSEILSIRWHTIDEIAALCFNDKLHTGFEEAAIRDFLRQGRPG